MTTPGPEGHILRQYREAAGLKVWQAADMVYMTPEAWARWEAGTRAMPMGLFELFCIKCQRQDWIENHEKGLAAP